ncbi:MAG: AAA family ATPase [Bacteroidetes bacterium]|nr:AAA family ATPase [Bacteroidota bacterium]
MNDQKQPFDPAAAFKASLLDPNLQVEKPPTIISINGQSCMTAGSFSVIIGRAKARKGFFIGSVTAAAASGRCTIDGIIGTFPEGRTRVIYFDTEQGAYWGNITHKRIIGAIGKDLPNDMIYSDLQQYPPAQRLQIIEAAISERNDISMVVIDGIRDLISSINDEAQATEMTSHILRWCATKKIHVVCILHQNKNDQNARGHIGSELINKAETVISVTKEKEDWVSTVKQEYCRDREFPFFSFCIDDEGLPRLTDQIEKPIVTKKNDEELKRFEYVFKDDERMNRALVVKRYMDASRLKESSADKHIAAALVKGIIYKEDDGFYTFSHTPTESKDENQPF